VEEAGVASAVEGLEGNAETSKVGKWVFVHPDEEAVSIGSRVLVGLVSA
jgi:hypothetical protein